MSQNSAKQNVTQLLSWLDTNKKKSSTTRKASTFSKADTYNSKQNYGNKSN